MSITIDLAPQDLAALKQFTKLDNDAQAVAAAALEFVRISRLRELKQASGQVEFEENWRELEQLEVKE
jgi:hypothetical protein